MQSTVLESRIVKSFSEHEMNDDEFGKINDDGPFYAKQGNAAWVKQLSLFKTKTAERPPL